MHATMISVVQNNFDDDKVLYDKVPYDKVLCHEFPWKFFSTVATESLLQRERERGSERKERPLEINISDLHGRKLIPEHTCTAETQRMD